MIKTKIQKYGGGVTIHPANLIFIISQILKNFKKEETAQPENTSIDKTKFVVVLSAFGKTTNLLEDIFLAKQEGRVESYNIGVQTLKENFRAYIADLFKGYTDATKNAITSTFLDGPFSEFVNTLQNLLIEKGKELEQKDSVLVYGEYFSVYIVAQYINKLYEKDRMNEKTASSVPTIGVVYGHQSIYTDNEFGNANILTEKTFFRNLCRNDITLVTGFTGCTEEGRPTTLGRESSDYTAVVFAYGLNMPGVELCKDTLYVLNTNQQKLLRPTVNECLEILSKPGQHPFIQPKALKFAGKYGKYIHFRCFDLSKYAPNEPTGTIVIQDNHHEFKS